MISCFPQIAAFLYNYYQLDHGHSAQDFVITTQTFRSWFPNAKERGMLCIHSHDEQANVGIYVEQKVKDLLEAHNPLQALTNHNLDAFLVVIEEASHFHYVMQRVSHQLPVTGLEVETQGEIDKFLVCAALLKEQCGDSHALALAHLVFDRSIVTAEEPSAYELATKLAARFWLDVAGYHHLFHPFHPKLQKLLRANFRKPLYEKRAYAKNRSLLHL